MLTQRFGSEATAKAISANGEATLLTGQLVACCPPLRIGDFC